MGKYILYKKKSEGEGHTHNRSRRCSSGEHNSGPTRRRSSTQNFFFPPQQRPNYQHWAEDFLLASRAHHNNNIRVRVVSGDGALCADVRAPFGFLISTHFIRRSVRDSPVTPLYRSRERESENILCSVGTIHLSVSLCQSTTPLLLCVCVISWIHHWKISILFKVINKKILFLN